MKLALFTTSSAAYRSIRQFEAKGGVTNAIVEKLAEGYYLRLEKTKELDFDTLIKTKPNVKINDKVFKYFYDSSTDTGAYYELKKGNRRRPNSQVLSLIEVYTSFHENTVTI